MENYDVVLIGATYLSVGFARAFKGKSLIIDAKGKPGYEFTDSFHIGEGYENLSLSKEGEEFWHYCNENGLCENYFTPEWTGYMSKYICGNDINCLLFTNILNIRDYNNKKLLTLFNSYGESEISADLVIDTRTESFSVKTLNAIINSPGIEEFSPEMKIIYKDKELAVVSFNLPLEYDYPKARTTVFESWAKRPDSLKNVKIAAVADEFYKKSDKEYREIDCKHIEYYSAFYSNPISAFDKGARLGGKYNA